MKVDELNIAGPGVTSSGRDTRIGHCVVDGAVAAQITTNAGADEAVGWKAAYLALVDPSTGDTVYLRYDSTAGQILAVKPGTGSQVVATF
jgi:hypothetical protein